MTRPPAVTVPEKNKMFNWSGAKLNKTGGIFVNLKNAFLPLIGEFSKCSIKYAIMSDKVYSIRDMEVISGVRAHTIRMWERRYSLL